MVFGAIGPKAAQIGITVAVTPHITRFGGSFRVVVMDFDQRVAALNIDMLDHAPFHGDNDMGTALVFGEIDVAPDMTSFRGRICSGFAPLPNAPSLEAGVFGLKNR